MRRLIFIFVLFLLFPSSVKAQAYGDGTYGSGAYPGTTATPTPAPTLSPPGEAPSTPTCVDLGPVGSSKLFRIDRFLTSATLYFTPVTGVNTYHVFFGYDSNDEMFAGVFEGLVSEGVLSVEVNYLEKNLEYTFKVRGVNGCAGGPWSETLTATPGITGLTTKPMRSSQIPVKLEEKKVVKELDKPVNEILKTKPQIESDEKLNMFQRIIRLFRNLFRL